MRYAIFTDIHANLEALEAVLAKIDEIAEKEPIDQIWFLGDLVGYGPNPNECILKLRERTDVIIAGNHDWAAVGRIDLEDFSAAARVSAEWTAEQLTEEHRAFLANLPERLEIGECTLVHGSPFGPLWEYLTSEVLAERSFQYFSSRYCLVGHTHVPVIFIQPDTIANTPTLPLSSTEEHVMFSQANGSEHHLNGEHASEEGADDETAEMVTTYPPAQQSTLSVQSRAENAPSAYKDPNSGVAVSEAEANAIIEQKLEADSMHPAGNQPEGQHIEEVPIDQVAEVVEPDSIEVAENTPPVQQQAAMLVSDVPETGAPFARIDDVATEEDDEGRVIAIPFVDDESAPNAPTSEKTSEEDESPAMVSSTEHEPAAVAEDAQISSIKTQETSIPVVEAAPPAQEENVASTDAPARETDTASEIPPTETGTEEDDDTAEAFPLAESDAITGDDALDLTKQMNTEEPLIFFDNGEATGEITPEYGIAEAEERLNSEIEELLTLLGLSESMVQVTNEMLAPPEGRWEAPPDYRAIINPGGVGQPRDGDPHAAFMIYDTERGFEFYRIPYDFEKPQEKIIQAGLPHYLAVRLAYGR